MPRKGQSIGAKPFPGFPATGYEPHPFPGRQEVIGNRLLATFEPEPQLGPQGMVAGQQLGGPCSGAVRHDLGMGVIACGNGRDGFLVTLSPALVSGVSHGARGIPVQPGARGRGTSCRCLWGWLAPASVPPL